MGCVCDKEDSPNPETWRTSLMQLVWTYTGKFVLVRRWITRQNLLVSFWLSRQVFFVAQTPVISICDTPESVRGDLCGHIPICRMNNKIRVPVTELMEVIVNLSRALSAL
jgi:hypothetical protein